MKKIKKMIIKYDLKNDNSLKNNFFVMNKKI